MCQDASRKAAFYNDNRSNKISLTSCEQLQLSTLLGILLTRIVFIRHERDWQLAGTRIAFNLLISEVRKGVAGLQQLSS